MISVFFHNEPPDAKKKKQIEIMKIVLFLRNIKAPVKKTAQEIYRMKESKSNTDSKNIPRHKNTAPKTMGGTRSNLSFISFINKNKVFD